MGLLKALPHLLRTRRRNEKRHRPAWVAAHLHAKNMLARGSELRTVRPTMAMETSAMGVCSPSMASREPTRIRPNTTYTSVGDCGIARIIIESTTVGSAQPASPQTLAAMSQKQPIITSASTDSTPATRTANLTGKIVQLRTVGMGGQTVIRGRGETRAGPRRPGRTL